jgi:hypothetical protein
MRRGGGQCGSTTAAGVACNTPAKPTTVSSGKPSNYAGLNTYKSPAIVRPAGATAAAGIGGPGSAAAGITPNDRNTSPKTLKNYVEAARKDQDNLKKIREQIKALKDLHGETPAKASDRIELRRLEGEERLALRSLEMNVTLARQAKIMESSKPTGKARKTRRGGGCGPSKPCVNNPNNPTRPNNSTRRAERKAARRAKLKNDLIEIYKSHGISQSDAETLAEQRITHNENKPALEQSFNLKTEVESEYELEMDPRAFLTASPTISEELSALPAAEPAANTAASAAGVGLNAAAGVGLNAAAGNTGNAAAGNTGNASNNNQENNNEELTEEERKKLEKELNNLMKTQ